MHLRGVLLGCSLLALTAMPVWASEEKAASYPGLSNELLLEIQSEHGYDSDTPLNERNNTFGRAELASGLAFSENWAVESLLVFEPVQAGDPGDDTFFENEGAYFEELKVSYSRGPWGAFFGKFDPGFGIAWDWGRGIWGEDFAEDYELAERLGFGVSHAFETEKSGTHTITASTFFADTTFLSQSTITGRGKLKKSDGGASNTEDFSSFALSLDGENVAGVENLGYHVGYRHQAEGDANTGGDDEDGLALNVRYLIPVTDRVKVDAFAEYAGIWNVDGSLDDMTYLTASAGVILDDHWNVTLSHTARQTDFNGGGDMNDRLTQLSAGYTFDCGLSLEAGWRGAEEAGVNTDIIGGLVRKTLTF